MEKQVRDLIIFLAERCPWVTVDSIGLGWGDTGVNLSADYGTGRIETRATRRVIQPQMWPALAHYLHAQRDKHLMPDDV